MLNPNSERSKRLRQELIDALQKAIEIGLKINVEGMTTDEAAEHVINTLQDHGCLRETRYEKDATNHRRVVPGLPATSTTN